MEENMKRTLLNITLASIITLVAYIALYAIWGAVLSTVENPTLKLLLIALMTTVAFGFVLLYIAKIRKGVGEDEVVSDYKDRVYKSVADDFKILIKRESQQLICMVAIVLICFVLNMVYGLVSEKQTGFPLTLFFSPMCLFSSLVPIPFVGYAVSAVLDCLVYIVFLLGWRKRIYNYWLKNKV